MKTCYQLIQNQQVNINCLKLNKFQIKAENGNEKAGKINRHNSDKLDQMHLSLLKV